MLLFFVRWSLPISRFLNHRIIEMRLCADLFKAVQLKLPLCGFVDLVYFFRSSRIKFALLFFGRMLFLLISSANSCSMNFYSKIMCRFFNCIWKPIQHWPGKNHSIAAKTLLRRQIRTFQIKHSSSGRRQTMGFKLFSFPKAYKKIWLNYWTEYNTNFTRLL